MAWHLGMEAVEAGRDLRLAALKAFFFCRWCVFVVFRGGRGGVPGAASKNATMLFFLCWDGFMLLHVME